jgi:hypothetical protein
MLAAENSCHSVPNGPKLGSRMSTAERVIAVAFDTRSAPRGRIAGLERGSLATAVAGTVALEAGLEAGRTAGAGDNSGSCSGG